MWPLKNIHPFDAVEIYTRKLFRRIKHFLQKAPLELIQSYPVKSILQLKSFFFTFLPIYVIAYLQYEMRSMSLFSHSSCSYSCTRQRAPPVAQCCPLTPISCGRSDDVNLPSIYSLSPPPLWASSGQPRANAP